MAPKKNQKDEVGAAATNAPDGDDAAEFVKYDLSTKITPYLDKHLVFPILKFLGDLEIYNKEDIGEAEIKLISQTFMVDFALDKYDAMGKERPEELINKREEVVSQLTEVQEREFALLKILEDEEAMRRIHAFKSISEVCEQFNVSLEQVEGLVTYAKMQFECGNYSLSSEILKHYRSLTDKDAERVMTSKGVSCMWGSIVSHLLVPQYEEAAESITLLSEHLDNAKMPKREVLLQRTWLVHWTLFAIFKSNSVASAPPKALDLFLHEKSLSIMSLSCPHLFRYVCACLIMSKRLRLALNATVWIIQLESGSYSDPITRFLVSLYTDLDFDGAQLELQECRKVCKADFFLAEHWEDFEENARLLIFETYCRIHQCINIDMIATKLNMTPEEAELWIVKLIQNAKLDARIDSEKRRVVMSKAPPSVYHQVIEKTKNLSFRSTMLLSNLEKRENEKKGILY